jgi:hypothetical protein
MKNIRNSPRNDTRKEYLEKCVVNLSGASYLELEARRKGRSVITVITINQIPSRTNFIKVENILRYDLYVSLEKRIGDRVFL